MATARMIQHQQEAARAVGGGPGRRPANVGGTERMVSKYGGGALIVAGLARGGLRGVLAAGLGGALLYRGISGHCPVYDSLGLDNAEADPEPGPMASIRAGRGVRVEEATLVARPADDIYLYWRDHANLPRFMSEVASVTSPDGVRSHWVMEAPLGLSVEWDAEIINDEPGRLISWRSLPGGQIDTAGTVRFSPTAKPGETEVRVNQRFDFPGGKLTAGLAKLFGRDPASLTRENLRRLKQVMEAGEVATVAGQPSGR